MKSSILFALYLTLHQSDTDDVDPVFFVEEKNAIAYLTDKIDEACQNIVLSTDHQSQMFVNLQDKLSKDDSTIYEIADAYNNFSYSIAYKDRIQYSLQEVKITKENLLG